MCIYIYTYIYEYLKVFIVYIYIITLHTFFMCHAQLFSADFRLRTREDGPQMRSIQSWRRHCGVLCKGATILTFVVLFIYLFLCLWVCFCPFLRLSQHVS